MPPEPVNREIWRCEGKHLDDFHLSVEGVPERCSRCGASTERYVPASSVADLEAENERLKVAGEGLADAIRGLDSYAAGSFPAPLERTERADAALKAWAALHPEPTEENE